MDDEDVDLVRQRDRTRLERAAVDEKRRALDGCE
jgi:hypothetical protein